MKMVNYLLQMLHHIMNVDKENNNIFFSLAITMREYNTSRSLYMAILNSINLSYNLKGTKKIPFNNLFDSELKVILENLCQYTIKKNYK